MERNDWQVVDLLPPPYSKCAISGFSDGPFVDFRVRMHAIDPNVGVNVSVLKDAARFVGMVTPEDHLEVVEQLDTAHAEIADLEAKLNELQAFKESVDTIVSSDFVARKKPGRPTTRVA